MKTNQLVSDFLDMAVYTFYEEGNPIKTVIGNVTLEIAMENLSDGSESIFIEDIYTNPKFQGKGEASKVLKAIINYADSNNTMLSLRAFSGGHNKITGMNQNNLVKWYEKNGFVLNPESCSFGLDEIFMTREPQI